MHRIDLMIAAVQEMLPQRSSDPLSVITGLDEKTADVPAILIGGDRPSQLITRIVSPKIPEKR